MAATPKAGSMTFLGLTSGTYYQVSIYNPDVAAGFIRWDNGSGTPTSTSTGNDFAVFTEPVKLVDASVVTGIVDTTQLKIFADYKPTSYSIYWANHVNSLNNRPPLNIGFKAGTRISMMSFA